MTNKILENLVEDKSRTSDKAQFETENVRDEIYSHAYRAGRATRRFLAPIGRYAKRYGLAEIAATTATAGAAKIAYDLTKSENVAVAASNVSSYIAFFGVIIAQDYRAQKKKADEEKRAFGLKDLGRMAVNLVKEFGPASYIDMFITRPLVLKEAIQAYGPATGGFVGKWFADVPYWIIADSSARYLSLDKIKTMGQKMKSYFHRLKGGTK